MNKKKKIEIKILRQDDESSDSYWQIYSLDVKETSRVLDLLEEIRSNLDSSLSFRANCGQGSCGSDAMQINGQNRLACQTLLSKLGFPDKLVLRPLPGFKVLKDLIVDQEKMRTKTEEIDPFYSSETNVKTEHLQSADEQQIIMPAVSCIRCGACQSACPAVIEFPGFAGPAPLTTAYRYLFDSRDNIKQQRLETLKNQDIWKCFTIYNCIEVCPREINVTELISELKKISIE